MSHDPHSHWEREKTVPAGEADDVPEADMPDVDFDEEEDLLERSQRRLWRNKRDKAGRGDW